MEQEIVWHLQKRYTFAVMATILGLGYALTCIGGGSYNSIHKLEHTQLLEHSSLDSVHGCCIGGINHLS